jgi:molybdate transport system substrate-binding protein
MRKNIVHFLVIIALFMNASGCGIKKEKKLSIFVPCSIFAAFCEILDGYKKEYPDVKISFDTGNSVVLMRKIRDKNARPDIFIASGPREMMPLLEKKLILAETIVPIANDSVVLVTPASNLKNITRVEDLAKPEVKSISIPDPKINSSGMVAVALLQNQGIWDKIKDRVIFTEFGRNTRNYITENKADAAIMYRSCLYEDLKAYDKVIAPNNMFVVEDLIKNQEGKIQSGVGILASSKNKKLAEDFIKYMTSENAKAIFKKWEGKEIVNK